MNNIALQNSVPAIRTNVRLRALKFHDIIINIEEQCDRLCYYNRRIFYRILQKELFYKQGVNADYECPFH